MIWRRGLPWLALILLLATLAGAVAAHLSTQAALSRLAEAAQDQGTSVAGRLAQEHGRLYASVLETRDGAPPVLLRRRYEQFVQLLSQLRTGPWRERFATLPRFEPTLAQVDAFVARIDDQLGSSAGVPSAEAEDMPRAAVAEMLRLLPPLREPLADLSQSASAATAVGLGSAVAAVARGRRVEVLAAAGFSGCASIILVTGLLWLRSRRPALGIEKPASGPQLQPVPAPRAALLAAIGRDVAGPMHRVVGTLGVMLAPSGAQVPSAATARAALDQAEDVLALGETLEDAAQLVTGRVAVADALFDLDATAQLALLGLDDRVREDGGRVLVSPILPANALWQGDAARLARVIRTLVLRVLPSSPGSVVVVVVREEAGALVATIGDQAAGTLAGSAFETVRIEEDWPGENLTDGLAAAVALTEALGGELRRARAGAGRAEAVRVLLPFRPLALGAAPATVRDTANAADTREGPWHVLAVDDVPTNRRLIAAVLERHGHVCDLAADGREAVRMVRAGRYDAVLMDVQMPGLDGLETTRLIRALPPPAGLVPVIAVTAHVQPGQRDGFLEAGMEAVVEKPVSSTELISALVAATGARIGLEPAAPPAEPLLDEPTLALVRSTLPGDGFVQLVQRQITEGAGALDRARAAARDGDGPGLREAVREVAAAYEALGARRLVLAARGIDQDIEQPMAAVATLERAVAETEAMLRRRVASAPLSP